MKSKFALSATAALMTVLFSMPGMAADTAQEKAKVKMKDNGGYEATRSSAQETPDGTKHSKTSDVDVSVDSHGNVSKTQEATSVTDPEGMMNKKENKSKTTMEERDHGGYKQTDTQSQTDANGTSTMTKTTTDVDVDGAGNVSKTVKTDKTIDPPGPLNKQTNTTETKSVNGSVVEQK